MGSEVLRLSLSQPLSRVSSSLGRDVPKTPYLTWKTDGGTESIAITAGETKDPAKNLPRVVKNVFWRILIFLYVFPTEFFALATRHALLTSLQTVLSQSSSLASTSHTVTLSLAQRQ